MMPAAELEKSADVREHAVREPVGTQDVLDDSIGKRLAGSRDNRTLTRAG